MVIVTHPHLFPLDDVVYKNSAVAAVLHSDIISETTPQGNSNITYECVDPIYQLDDKMPDFQVSIVL